MLSRRWADLDPFEGPQSRCWSGFAGCRRSWLGTSAHIGVESLAKVERGASVVAVGDEPAAACEVVDALARDAQVASCGGRCEVAVVVASPQGQSACDAIGNDGRE